MLETGFRFIFGQNGSCSGDDLNVCSDYTTVARTSVNRIAAKSLRKQEGMHSKYGKDESCADTGQGGKTSPMEHSLAVLVQDGNIWSRHP